MTLFVKNADSVLYLTSLHWKSVDTQTFPPTPRYPVSPLTVLPTARRDVRGHMDRTL